MLLHGCCLAKYHALVYLGIGLIRVFGQEHAFLQRHAQRCTVHRGGGARQPRAPPVEFTAAGKPPHTQRQTLIGPIPEFASHA